MRRTIFETEHEDFRAAVREFVEREIKPHVEEHGTQGEIPQEVWRTAGGHGFLGLCVPEDLGGAGVDDYRFNAVLDEELVQAGLAYACALGVHTHVIAPYLVNLTTPDQRKRWLPSFCRGELITAIAMTEPSGGSDLAALRTRAVRHGQEWVINGAKTFITNGASATLTIVAAQTEPGSRSKGITLFAVEAGTPGFDHGRRLSKVGQPQGDTAELYFDEVRISDDAVIGEVGGGFPAMMKHLAQERLASAVCNIAHARKVLDEAIAHVKRREAFGKTIAALQHTRFLLADLVTEAEVTQAFVDACIAAHVAHELTPEQAAMAKLKSSEVQGTIVDAAVQMHGGLGYMRESAVAQDWMDARVTRIWAGTNEIMREVIGRSVTR
ncbi:acyl-CoA dehydrogenase family protein [Streptomyces sp. NPDC056390]|uniref:acyl-CoA dehydrogenase family protein n=1 Tax=Streptomyces sp. NPDC056390 TaxID=3345806 RepID=UPI0035D77966